MSLIVDLNKLENALSAAPASPNFHNLSSVETLSSPSALIASLKISKGFLFPVI